MLKTYAALKNAVVRMAGKTGDMEFEDAVPDFVTLAETRIEREMRWKHGEIPALSTSTTTNFLLEAAPDVYLYGTLVAAVPFLRGDERVQAFEQLFQNAMDEYRRADDLSRFGRRQVRWDAGDMKVWP
jgi:hypothetical protein